MLVIFDSQKSYQIYYSSRDTFLWDKVYVYILSLITNKTVNKLLKVLVIEKFPPC